uniref:heterogeneous nuclear ribonucleoprotein 1-like n=1 Tax=Erigeron canadensis TaxID=72917 RepID=UPI001CB93BEC|nr:heterogeneous nuclear ribonucleoprotein 1-like [Erigeron canadensis]
MDSSDEGKLFIGGIAWDTTEETLSDYFSKYGVVSQTVIMRDKTTGRPRGFGFVVFSDPSVLDSVLQDRHTIEGRTVEAKRALSREEQQTSRPGNNIARSSGGSGNYRTKKIFVGGLPSTLTEEQFRQYFEAYGDVTDVVIMFDQNTNRPRGFGFISFDTEDAVDRVVQKTFHELNNKLVEVKRALPKDANPGGGGGGGRAGGYQGNNAGSYDNQMDGKRFMQQNNAGGGYPPYSGYGQPSYGFGGPNPNAGYGGYGSYGVGGYGSANTGYGGPTGAYGNPSAMKTSWGGQSPGYGGTGYGPNVGYGANAPWNAAGGGPAASAPMSQSASGASGYGGQPYGYGNYGSNDGYNGNPGGYGAPAGGRFGPGGVPSIDQQGPGAGGNMGSGYNGQPGYSNAGWRSDS